MKPLALSIKRAGKAVGLKRSSIYSLLKQGRLRAVKLGSRTLITVASLEELIAQPGNRARLNVSSPSDNDVNGAPASRHGVR